MKRCAYLTMDDDDGWMIDAHLAFPFMEQMGWQIEPIPWRQARADWNTYTAVYVGTPWDYPGAAEQFIGLLQEIDRSGAILVNDYALIEWTVAKTYLRDLEERGIDIVPSLWLDTYDATSVSAAFAHFGVQDIIVKPVISTNATDTYRLHRSTFHESTQELQDVFHDRPFLVQPYIANIESEGEFSLFFFNAKFSHAILKTPKVNDFRVQEEFGANIVAVQPTEALLAVGRKVLEKVQPDPVYARLDFVRTAEQQFLLMELELIEPSMYLRMDVEAPQRFAAAFDSYVSSKREKNHD